MSLIGRLLNKLKPKSKDSATTEGVVFDAAYRGGVLAQLLHALKVSDVAHIVMEYAWVPPPITWNVTDWFQKGSQHDPGALWCRLPHSSGQPALPARPCRVSASVSWVDQGWGNRKGRLELRAYRSRSQDDEKDEKEERSLVFRKSLFGNAGHKKETKEVCLTGVDLEGIEAQDECELWVLVGGGGGHSLRIDKFDIEIAFSL